jgi:hypothetical protein
MLGVIDHIIFFSPFAVDSFYLYKLLLLPFRKCVKYNNFNIVLGDVLY